MHDPGPPRTTSVGESVELAPRSPEPDGAYKWTIADAPAASSASTEDESGSDTAVLRPGETNRADSPVVHLAPDAPGTYVLTLDAPNGTHRQRVRVFPDERRTTELRVPASDLPVDDTDIDRVSLMWAHNENLLARDRPERDGDDWVCDVRVPPGRHAFSFVANDDPGASHREICEVPGPGRPRLSLDATVAEDGTDETDGATLLVAADIDVPPDLGATVGDDSDDAEGVDPTSVDVEFLVDDRDADPESVTRIESLANGHTLAVPLAELPEIVRIHAVPHAARYGAMDTVRVERGHEADGELTAIDDSDDGSSDGDSPHDGSSDGDSPHDGSPRDSVTITDPHAAPQWADSPTIYEVFVRSFAGDTLPTTFREIERRVPYIESLGVDALWLTPVLASPTEHGYHITDYYDTAADLGSHEAFESLVETCHEAGIRVVFDLVINHTSRDHPVFQMHAAGVDAYADHYRRTDGAFDVTDTDWAELDDGDMPEYYFNWRRIPNLNFDSPAVRGWLLDVVDEWAEVVDGFRADVAWGIPHGFWKEVADRVSDDVLLLDETLPHDPFYGEGEFDLHYDTSLYETLREIGAGEAPADALADALDRAEWLGFGDPSDQMRYVENHDEDRYLAEHGRAALRAAAAVTFTLPGTPMIYAGQERGNETYRGAIRWHDGDNDLTAFHRRLAALRDAEPLLRDGAVDFEGRAADVTVINGDDERVTAYERVPESDADAGEHDNDSGARDIDGEHDTDGEGLLVVVNFASEPATVTVPDRFETELFETELFETELFDDDGSDPIDGAVTVDAVAVLR